MSSTSVPSRSYPKPRAVAFDLDGLIFDTEALFARVAREMVESLGKPFSPEVVRAMIGRRAVESAETFKRLSGLEGTPNELMAELKRRFFLEVDSAVHPTAGLFSLLTKLEHLKIPRAVATSSKRDYAEKLLRRHGIIDQFKFVLTADDVSNGKPDPEIYLTAASRFGVSPDRMVVLEDSAAGLTAAKGAGAIAVAVPHEHSPAAGLSHADLIIERLDAPTLYSLLSTGNPAGPGR